MLAVMILSCSMSIFAIAAYENNYSNTGNQRIDIIGVAKTQVGYAEGNNNNNKYGYYFGHNYVPWCAYFIVWCARQANIGSNTIKLSGYADADDLGVAYKSRGSYTPQTGDIIIFDYAPYSTKTPASSYGDHVGLVEYVDGNYVHTIEGNANNAVRRYTYSLSNSNIKGYGVPNYSGGYTHTRDSSYGTNFTSYPKAKITASNIFDANHTQISSTCWIGTSDQCTIHEVYTDGCCKVTYPLDSGGSKTVYSKISLFNTHTHSYSKNYEAAHPHRYYMKCSCGDYYYTGETKYLATCSSCHTHSYTGDLKYQPDHPHRISQRCTEYSSCGGFIWLDKYYYCSDCSQCQSDFGARIKASVSSITLDLNGKNTQTITVTADGHIPWGYRFNRNIADTSVISGTWAEKLIDNKTSITVTGKKCGSTNLTLSVYETTTGNKNTLHKIVIPVTVTCSHSYNSGTVTTAATCKSTGVKTYTCTVCKATKTETIAKNSSNHTGGTTIKNAKSATCSSEGYTGDKYCSGCGAKLSTGKTIAKTAHPWNSGTVTTAATCTKAGVKTYTCTVCKATKTENIPVIAHTAVKDPAIAASCTKTGLTEGSHCSTCNTVIRKQETTKALGHDFNGASHTNSDGSISYKCTRCDEYGNTVYPQPTEENLDAISGTKRIMENNLDILVAPVEMTAESIFKAAKGGKLADSSGNEITNGNTPLATGMKILPGNSEICVSILGDVDCDGDIDVADARFALRAAVKLDTLTDVCFIAADIDFSKDISVSDARLILRAAVKLDEPKAWLK